MLVSSRLSFFSFFFFFFFFDILSLRHLSVLSLMHCHQFPCHLVNYFWVPPWSILRMDHFITTTVQVFIPSIRFHLPYFVSWFFSGSSELLFSIFLSTPLIECDRCHSFQVLVKHFISLLLFFTSWDSFKPSLADGISLEFEWLKGFPSI